MSPLKPTRSPSRRVGIPKPSTPESALAPPSQATELEELPTDLSALAVILESAMVAGHPRAQLSTPESQEPDPNAEVHSVETTDLQDEDPFVDIELPVPASAVQMMPAEAPPRPAETSEREAVAFDEVARSLAAAEACVPLLAQATGLMRIAALDVVKAETARAGGLLQLLRFLRGDVTPPITAVSTAVVIQRIAQAAEAECRLRGIDLTTRSSVADATCAGDETLLTNAVLAQLLITFALIAGVQNARAMLSVTLSDRGEIGLAVSQDHVPAPKAWMERTGSEELPVDTTQVVPAMVINAAQRLARTWRGRFAMASGEHSSILTLWLPSLQPDDVTQLPH